MNTGHGHVFPREDGVKARCGGPLICAECAKDFARKNSQAPTPETPLSELREEAIGSKLHELYPDWDPKWEDIFGMDSPSVAHRRNFKEGAAFGWDAAAAHFQALLEEAALALDIYARANSWFATSTAWTWTGDEIPNTAARAALARLRAAQPKEGQSE